MTWPCNTTWPCNMTWPCKDDGDDPYDGPLFPILLSVCFLVFLAPVIGTVIGEIRQRQRDDAARRVARVDAVVQAADETRLRQVAAVDAAVHARRQRLLSPHEASFSSVRDHSETTSFSSVTAAADVWVKTANNDDAFTGKRLGKPQP